MRSFILRVRLRQMMSKSERGPSVNPKCLAVVAVLVSMPVLPMGAYAQDTPPPAPAVTPEAVAGLQGDISRASLDLSPSLTGNKITLEPSPPKVDLSPSAVESDNMNRYDWYRFASRTNREYGKRVALDGVALWGAAAYAGSRGCGFCAIYGTVGGAGTVAVGGILYASSLVYYDIGELARL